MGRICARCGVRFPGAYGLRMAWCKVDRFFVCRSCWEKECGEGHGQGVNAREVGPGKMRWAVLAAVIILPWVLVLANDYAVLKAWEDSPIVPIATLHVGQAARVAGVIEDTDAVALGGYEVSVGRHGGWDWLWNDTASFFVRDGTDAIRVVSAHWYRVAPGPHPAPNVHRSSGGTLYLPGDRVLVFGHVERSGDGTLFLDALVIGTGFDDPLPGFLTIDAVFVLVVALSFVVEWAAADSLRKRRDHAKAVTGRNPIDLDTTPAPRTPGLDWRANGRARSSRQRLHVFLAVALVVGLFMAGVWIVWGPHELRMYFYIAVFFNLPVFVVIWPAGVWALYRESDASAVALSEEGIRFWYDSPYDRRLNYDLVPWSEVRLLPRRKGEKVSYVPMPGRMSAKSNYWDRLSAPNREAVAAEWSRRTVEGALLTGALWPVEPQ